MTDPIFPCIWFDKGAKEAADFYFSVFKNSKIIEDNPMVVTFELNGKKFIGLNGNAQFAFNDSISFVVNCDTQEEIDHYWEQLTKDGQENMCGWLKDKYGVSWQIVPTLLMELLNNAEKTEKIIATFMKMKKLDISKLLEA
jgi:predicted 3-demethylubiquinone-9 3-methyltransferase (glyoxalase superfamily)